MTLPAPNPNARLTRYRYDDTDRLIAASSALNVPDAPILASYAYGYDKASNLVSMNGNGIVRDLDVTATNALSAGTYDAGGNPLKLGAATYGWDAANRLVSHTVNNTDSSFVYDGQSRLVRIVDRQEGVVVADKSYLWCGLERCLERDNMKAGAPVSKRYFAQGVVQDGVPFRYISDSLGSVRQLVDADGRTRARYDFEPYGSRNTVNGDIDVDFAFGGLFRHGSSGLAFAVYRGYDPRRGRWLNRDPIGEAGGLNLFAYVEGNPLVSTDPLGLIHYNRPPPATVPVTGPVATQLQCVELCLRRKTGNSSLDLLITGGAEKTSHSPRSFHYKGEACDIAGPRANNAGSDADVKECATACGFGAGQFESFPNTPNRDHWHLQLIPGNGVPSLGANESP